MAVETWGMVVEDERGWSNLVGQHGRATMRGKEVS